MQLRELLRYLRAHPNERSFYFQAYLDSKLQHVLSTRKVIAYTVLTSVGYSIYTQYKVSETWQYRLNSTRNISWLTGKAARVTIPKIFRRFIYTKFSAVYGVNLDEIEESDLTNYNTFLEFFTRKIKPRPVDQDPLSVVSPADCKILAFSEINSNEAVIVKDISYKLGELLTGIPNYPIENETMENMKRNKENKLFHCILYLCPGDYHRFHSPTELIVKQRNHILGTLLPVKEQYALTGKMKYEKNERVSVFGDWKGGFMSLVFVGALNVGSIELNFDPELKTNSKPSTPFQPSLIKSFKRINDITMTFEDFETQKKEPNGILIPKGEEIGRFNLGSSIVLFFEAHKDFKFEVKEGQDIKYGQVLGK